jgi:hypothetical protein
VKSQEAGTRALMLKVLSVAPTATPRMRAMAIRFSERFEAYRHDGVGHAAAYAMASAESEAYLREMDRERAFA